MGTEDGTVGWEQASYDILAVLYSVRGLRDYWTAVTVGSNVIESIGTNHWEALPDANHSYLVESMDPTALANIINNLLADTP